MAIHASHRPELGDRVLIPGCQYCMVCLHLLTGDRCGETARAAQPCPGPSPGGLLRLDPSMNAVSSQREIELAEQAHEWHQLGMRDSQLARWMVTQIDADQASSAQNPMALRALRRVVDQYAMAYGDPARHIGPVNSVGFEVIRRLIIILAEQYRDRPGYAMVVSGV